MTRRRAGAVAALLIAVASLAAAPSPAAATGPTTGVCPDGSGITVVVDYRELGGGVVTRCAPGPWASGDTGFTVLERAGFQVTRVQKFPGALCRIDDKPTREQDACVNMPPTVAYWSYWLAYRGGDWCYSNLGAGNRRAIAGTVEGWSFSKDRTEETSPPPGAATPPPVGAGPPPTIGRQSCVSEVVPTTTTGPTTTAPPAGGGDVTPTTATGQARSTTTAAPPPDGSTTTTLADGTTSSSTSSTLAGQEVAVAERSGDGGSPAGALIGLGLVVVLGGGAALAVQVRRRGDAGP